MTIPVWAAGYYAPGDVVIPTAAPALVVTSIDNGNFDAGDTGWTKGTGWTIGTDRKFNGTHSAKFNNTGTAQLLNNTARDVLPGTSVTINGVVDQGASSEDEATAALQIVWLDAANVVISTTTGTAITSGSDGSWKAATVTGVAPAGTAKAKAAVTATRTGGGDALWVDNLSWNVTAPDVPSGLYYRAVQAAYAATAANEPVWPLVNGVQVVDGDVTWEAVTGTRVEWTGYPILKSGATEPDWPLENGAIVADNTIGWTAITQRITDAKCPNGKVVVMGASKIFCANYDIVNFCATDNARDWTTAGDAGFLPVGMQEYGANDVAVLNIYRGNLVVMSSEVFQMWQIDPDPALMSIIDSMPAIGSTYHEAAMPVAGDLLYLPPLGVRSIGIAGGSASLDAGDVGKPVDPLIREALAAANAAGLRPMALYYPAAGQYWLIFPQMEAARLVFESYVEGPPTVVLAEDVAGEGDFSESTATPALGSTSATYTAAFSPDGRLMAVPHDETGVTIYVWDGVEYTLAAEIELEDAIAATFSPTGEHLYVGRTAAETHGPFKIYSRTDDATWVEIYEKAETGFRSTDGAWSADGNRFCATSIGETIFAYSVSGDVYTPVVFPEGDGTVFVALMGDLLLASAFTVDAGVSVYKFEEGEYTFLYVLPDSGYGNPIVSRDSRTVIIDGVVYTREEGTDTLTATGTVIGTTGDTFPGRILYDGRVIYSADGGLYLLEAEGDDYVVAETIYGSSWLLGAAPEARSVGPGCEAFVFDIGSGTVGKWCRYVFPFSIDGWTLLGDDLVLRAGDTFVIVDAAATEDAVWNEVESIWSTQGYEGVVWWPWLDFGTPGQDKEMVGIDIIATGLPTVDIGYDQKNKDRFGEAIAVPDDTLYDGPVPYEITAPTLSIRITFEGGTAWKLNAINMLFAK